MYVSLSRISPSIRWFSFSLYWLRVSRAQLTLFNRLVLTMIGNVGYPCEEGATITDFTSGCNSTVDGYQVLPPPLGNIGFERSMIGLAC